MEKNLAATSLISNPLIISEVSKKVLKTHIENFIISSRKLINPFFNSNLPTNWELFDLKNKLIECYLKKTPDMLYSIYSKLMYFFSLQMFTKDQLDISEDFFKNSEENHYNSLLILKSPAKLSSNLSEDFYGNEEVMIFRKLTIKFESIKSFAKFLSIFCFHCGIKHPFIDRPLGIYFDEEYSSNLPIIKIVYIYYENTLQVSLLIIPILF